MNGIRRKNHIHIRHTKTLSWVFHVISNKIIWNLKISSIFFPIFFFDFFRFFFLFFQFSFFIFPIFFFDFFRFSFWFFPIFFHFFDCLIAWLIWLIFLKVKKNLTFCESFKYVCRSCTLSARVLLTFGTLFFMYSLVTNAQTTPNLRLKHTHQSYV